MRYSLGTYVPVLLVEPAPVEVAVMSVVNKMFGAESKPVVDAGAGWQVASTSARVGRARTAGA